MPNPVPAAEPYAPRWQQLDTAIAAHTVTPAPATTPEESVTRIQMRLGTRFVTAVEDARQGIPVIPIAPDAVELTP